MASRSTRGTPMATPARAAGAIVASGRRRASAPRGRWGRGTAVTDPIVPPCPAARLRAGPPPPGRSPVGPRSGRPARPRLGLRRRAHRSRAARPYSGSTASTATSPRMRAASTTAAYRSSDETHGVAPVCGARGSRAVTKSNPSPTSSGVTASQRRPAARPAGRRSTAGGPRGGPAHLTPAGPGRGQERRTPGAAAGRPSPARRSPPPCAGPAAATPGR